MAIFPGSAIPSAADAAYEIDNSLRFNKADDPRLTRTPGSSGNRKTWTFSCWYKNTVVDSYQKILSAGANADTTNNYTTRLYIDSDPTNYLFRFKQDITAGNADLSFLLTRVIRDPGAWYHFCVAVDTTQATEANRVKIYINGVLLTASDYTTASYPDQDDDTYVNHTNLHMIGHGEDSIDGYLAEVYLIDGTQLAASDFGETDSTTNQWIPLDSDDVKDAVTFGTNGFYQKYNSTELATSFTDSSSAFVPTEPLTVDYLVIAGGGGGNAQGGGGGAGGYRCSVVGENTGGGGSAEAALSVSAQSYPITVGAGGAQNTNGSNSVFSTITAIGGGTGGDEGAGPTVGGSGGGGGRLSQAGAAAASPTQGYAGGDAGPSPESGNIAANYSAGGGGGAGAVGEDNQGASGPGDGGDGLSSSIDGSATFRGGGGGGGKHTSGGSNSAGGNGGGGIGYVYTTTAGTAGTANTGGGGGGGAGQYGVVTGTGGAGGSGVVIIRYISTTAKATGGTITSYVDSGNTYQVHTFTSGIHTITATGDVKNVRGADLDTDYDTFASFTSTGADTWTCPAGVTSVEVLTVAGGGGGAGYYYGGGGGSGGVVHNSTYSVTAGVVYDLTVGAGGAGGGATTSGTTGSDSVFNVNAEGSGLALTAKGGGGGGSYGAGDEDGKDGGSGGGAGPRDGDDDGGATIQASFSGATSYGNAGGSAGGISAAGSGGGGAGEAGNVDSAPTSGGAGGAGGDGVLFSSFTSYGVSGYFAGGGGGGGGAGPSVAGPGGTGGGGNGAAYNSSAAVAGTANTGGGGGAGSSHIGSPSTSNGAAGGSGVILIKWTLAKPGSSSIEFDGSGDYLSVPHTTDFNWAAANFTVECWARFNSLPSGTTYGILNNLTGSGSGAGGTGWQMDLEDDSGYKLRWQFWDTGGSSRTNHQSFTPTLNQWYHIAVVRNSDVFTTYIDGTSIGATTLAYTIKDYASAGGAEFIGANRDNSYNANNYLPGYLDEIRYSDTARYTTTFTPQRTQFTADANTKLLIHSDYTGGLGADSSGNYNNFTATNLVATDQMIDTPTNNFATWDPLCYSPNTTFKEGNLEHVGTSASASGNTPCTFTPPATGKWYWEEHCSNINSTQWPFIGTVDATVYEIVGTWSDNNGRPGESESNGGWKISADGEYETDGGGTSTGGQGFNATSDIIQFALDHTNGALYYGINNTWYTPTASSGDPTSGASKTGAVMTWTAGTRSFIPAVQNYNTSALVANFGQDSSFAGNVTPQGNQDGNSKGDFYYEPPSGYLALCTDNLSAPEIALPGDYFNTVLWTGDGAASRSITGTGFQADMMWSKIRNSVHQHNLVDRVRGVDEKLLMPNSNNAEDSGTPTHGWFDSLDSDGFTITGAGGDWNVNTNTYLYVGWNWKAGGAPTADNSAGAGATPTAGSVKIDGSNLGSALAGTIAATRISANTTSGFSIVKYVGTGVAATISHSLGVTPDLIIIKNLSSAEDWLVGSVPQTLGSGRMYLSTTAADSTSYAASLWNSTAATPSVFSVGDSAVVNTSTDNYVAYCFHSIEGYSKVGSYEGNGDADGTFVYTGFSPAMVIIKNIDDAQDWSIIDNKRPGYNEVDEILSPNLAAAEDAGTALDFTSNGFKCRNGSDINNDAKTMIYIAFAESPFKTSNAR